MIRGERASESASDEPERRPAVGVLSALLARVESRPSDHLCRRLRASDGPRWFDETIAIAWRELGSPATPDFFEATRPALLELKTLGKQRLASSRSLPEVEDATALYFAATILLLSRHEVQQVGEVSDLSLEVLESVLVVCEDTLSEAWRPLLDRALRFID